MAGDTEQLLKALQLMEEKITTNINKNIDQKFECLQKELHNIKITNEEQEKRISLIEKQLREKNLIFFGVPEGEKSYAELEKKIVEIIKNEMTIDCSIDDIEKVQRVGKMDTDKIRPINVTFVRLGTKIKILKRKKSLENTSIYVKHDFPYKVLEIRKNLQEQVKREREQGNKAVLRYDRIIVIKNNEISKTNSRSHVGQKRPLNITPPQNKREEKNHTRQKEKKNKTVSYDIRQYTFQDKSKENMTPEQLLHK